MSKDILEGNAKIAEFMGWKLVDHSVWDNEGWYWYNKNGNPVAPKEDLSFHENWNELMPVLKKIKGFDCDIIIDYGNRCIIKKYINSRRKVIVDIHKGHYSETEDFITIAYDAIIVAIEYIMELTPSTNNKQTI